jgi:hypothetical protein
MLKFQEARDLLSSEDVDEEVVGVREEAKIAVKEPK